MSRKTPEGKVVEKIESYFDRLIAEGHMIYYERRQAIGGISKKGLPDIWAVINGIHLEIEVKRSDGKGELSTSQLKWKERFLQLGIVCLTVESVEEVESAVALLEEVFPDE